MKTHAECDKIDQEEGSSESYFMEYEKVEDVPDNLKLGNNSKLYKDTMFSSFYKPEIINELPKCLRVMPHHQNTSGFFITIIEKLKEFDGAQLQDNKKQVKSDVPVFNVPKNAAPIFKAPATSSAPLFKPPVTVTFGGKTVNSSNQTSNASLSKPLF